MIRKVKANIESISYIAVDTIEMVLQNTYLSTHVRPGQFLHIQIPGHSLRRPISIADCNPLRGTITIIFKINGQGTKKLTLVTEGMELDVLGPCGNGYKLDNIPNKALLIGGGIGIPPLYYLGKRLTSAGCQIVSVLGFQTNRHLFYEQHFQNLGKTFVVTDDGSYGWQGNVTDVLAEIDSFDCYYSCGPTPMLQAVRNHLPDKEGYLSLEERMGCGIGACFACVIPTKDGSGSGYQKICKDGPVFGAWEVQL